MARAPVSKTGGWGFEFPPLLPPLNEINGLEAGLDTFGFPGHSASRS